jgi:hypothetical protein
VLLTAGANAVAEELFFRGALWTLVQDSHPLAKTTLAYAATTTTTRNPALVLAGTATSVLFGLQRRTSGGILAPALTHLTWSLLMQRESGASGGGFILLNEAGRDAPAVADRDALAFRPRPDVAAALPACCGTPRPAARPPASLAGVLDERRKLLPERPGVLLAQIDLVLGAAQPEPHRLLRRAPIKIVF